MRMVNYMDAQISKDSARYTGPLSAILSAGLALKASDILLVAGKTPMARVDGETVPLAGMAPLTAEKCRELILSGLRPEAAARFADAEELDYSFTCCGSRFRVNVFSQLNGLSAVYRAVSKIIPTPQELGLTPEMIALSDLPRGLVIVTGPTGCGKSSTLASLIELINLKYRKTIITLEDPVEFVYTDRKSTIIQREVGRHTRSFGDALRHALRQAPDVIMIGEMRDFETIQLAVTAAETGHLCLATLHTLDSASTVDRIIDVFPAVQQEQVRAQLSVSLQAVISQLLLPRKGGKGRVAARELLLANNAIRAIIRDKKTHAIPNTLLTSRKAGMMTMDQSMAELAVAGLITVEEALSKTAHPDSFRSLMDSATELKGRR